MSKFSIDNVDYDTDDLSDVQKRVVALYQQALKEEGEVIASLELRRAARVELGRKLKELVIEPKEKN